MERVAVLLGLEEELGGIIDKLVNLFSRGLVKTNHSVMEVVVAGFLIRKGYELVEVEYKLDNDLVCDIYGVKADSTLVVEVETGFTPPSNAVDPLSYLKARIVSKIARYGKYAAKMTLAIPPYYAAPIPGILLKPPKARSKKELEKLKRLVDRYYHNPPVPLKDLHEARLHSILIVDVEDARVEEVDPIYYYQALGDIIRRYTGNNVNT